MKPDAAFDARLAAKKLLREARSGALASLMPGSGDPYCSLVNVATAADGAPLMLLSQLAIHTKNILADKRVSLMLDERKDGDPLEGARVMLTGSCSQKPDSSARASFRASYLRRHPEAEQFVDFGDFSFFRMEIGQAHLVAGFGRIVDLSPQDILTDVSDASALIEAEEGAIAHMNASHEEACRLYATKLLGAPDGDWRCAGIDPEGIELQHGRMALRLPFPQRVTAPGPLRTVLKQLAEQARAR
ncbi:MAG: HugZ family protein [Deltaproteobacteria bacterium]|nr:HugZ family protein [Deltaproteobacteria bacterium]